MNNEAIALIIINLASIVYWTNEIFNFLPISSHVPDFWTYLYFVIVGIPGLYLLVKSAIKEALKEHHFDD